MTKSKQEWGEELRLIYFQVLNDKEVDMLIVFIDNLLKEERRRIKDIIWNSLDGLVAAKLIKEISL